MLNNKLCIAFNYFISFNFTFEFEMLILIRF